MFVGVLYIKENGEAKGHSCFSGTDEAMFGEDMEISKNKLHI